jgi:hypothetical protein
VTHGVVLVPVKVLVPVVVLQINQQYDDHNE